MPDLIRVERRDGRVAVVRLDNPPLNALSTALLDRLAGAFDDLAAAGDVHAVVVAGGGKAFAAGADIAELGGAEAARAVAGAFRRALDAVAAFPRPVIAAIGGYALGGGLELALACDLRVAGDSARLGQPEALLGIIPGGGATQRLPRLVGPARAKEMIWSGRQVRADEALAIGLVDRVVAAADVEHEALAWAGRFASGAVRAMGLAKAAIDASFDLDLPAGLDREAELFVEVFATEDARIGIESFRAHGPGKATFTGR
jgi:enoyl-CoA hydratase/carnithine racemase